MVKMTELTERQQNCLIRERTKYIYYQQEAPYILFAKKNFLKMNLCFMDLMMRKAKEWKKGSYVAVIEREG